MTEYAATPVCLNHPDVLEAVRPCTRCGRPFCGDCVLTIGGRPFCGDCKNEQLLDLRSGISDALPIAPPVRRLGAQIVDMLPWTVTGMVMLIHATSRGATPPRRFDPLMLAIWGSYVVYEALMLQFRSQTVGKMLVRTKVVRVDGSPITAAQAWGRSVLRFVLGFLYVVDWMPIFFTTERLCVHDMLARTRVIQTD